MIGGGAGLASMPMGGGGMGMGGGGRGAMGTQGRNSEKSLLLKLPGELTAEPIFENLTSGRQTGVHAQYAHKHTHTHAHCDARNGGAS